jgi:hypothetical protein
MDIMIPKQHHCGFKERIFYATLKSNIRIVLLLFIHQGVTWW